MVVKDSGCIKEQRLCSLLLRTMRNLLGRDLVPVCSVSDSVVWAVKSEESLLEGWGWLFTEALRNAGMVHDVWTRYMEAQRIWEIPTLSSGSKMEIWAYQPLKIQDIPIPMVFKQLVVGHRYGWKPCIQTLRCSHSSFHGQVGEDSPAWPTLWLMVPCDHLSFTTSLIAPRERSLVQINSPPSVGLWEKPTELAVARNETLEVC